MWMVTLSILGHHTQTEDYQNTIFSCCVDAEDLNVRTLQKFGSSLANVEELSIRTPA